MKTKKEITKNDLLFAARIHKLIRARFNRYNEEWGLNNPRKCAQVRLRKISNTTLPMQEDFARRIGTLSALEAYAAGIDMGEGLAFEGLYALRMSKCQCRKKQKVKAA